MKSLYNTNDKQEIINRIMTLSPHTPNKWGKMNVAQVLEHCQTGLKGAYGEIKFKRGLIGFLFGGLAKKSLTADHTPFKQNLPTDKAFIVVGQKDFEAEREKLLVLLKQFSPEKITKSPHPFFGKMTEKEWDIIQWKHLDHHLRQFGA